MGHTEAAAIPYGFPGPRAAPMYQTTIPTTSPMTVPICGSFFVSDMHHTQVDHQCAGGRTIRDRKEKTCSPVKTPRPVCALLASACIMMS